MRRAPRCGLWAAFGLVAGCDANRPLPAPEPGWERMIDQPRAEAYQPSPVFADGKVMRPLPPGVVPYASARPAAEMRTGLRADPGAASTPPPLALSPSAAEPYVDSIPVTVDRAMVERGRSRFEIFCAPCHGVAGDGDSVVAEKMALRRPPSLHEARLRNLPAGRLYRTIAEGYGLMPSYAVPLVPADRWAVVAYVQALQLSRHAPVDALPAAVQREVRRALP